MGGGVAAFDYDGDGCMDLFFANGAAIPSLKKTGPEYWNRLYRNRCDGTFTDVTQKAGVAGEGYSIAVATADFDNDGHVDLFVSGVNGNTLYRNRGDGTFEDVTAKAHVAGGSWAVSAGWFDYDNDGWLDLFVSNYVVWDAATEPVCGEPGARFYCHPGKYRGLPNQLFHNNHDGTFTDVSKESGIAKHIGKGMGIAFADFDGDGFPDVFVANDSVRNFLFRNRGDRTFQEVGIEAGVAFREDGAAIAGMGVDFRDFNNDGRPDIVVSGMINDGFLLFRNSGTLFEDFAQRSGLLTGTRQMTGWSLGMYDFDNDGWKDLFFALSHFPALERYLGRSAELPNRVFRNLEGRHFEDVSAGAGADFQKAGIYHGAAFADFDSDGRVDVVVTSIDGPAKLFRNVTEHAGHWLAVKLKGMQANRQGLGANIRVTLPDGRALYGQATTSVGYASASEPFVRFGLGSSTTATVEVHWPGSTQRLDNVKADRVIEIVQ